ncbi:hypothetical protein L7F22_065573 [Adiantum nelumboides]|nr:hypothetical protein [Adiantum nelumboides]
MDMNADASKDVSTVHLPYIEITRENGSIVRHCCATEDCSKCHLCFLKRVHMMRHLSDDHGIQVNIPKRPMGRPKGCNASTASNSFHSMRQSKTRFTDNDAKIRNARNKHMCDKETAAKTFWESLDDDNKPPLDVWRKNYVAEAMARWESGMPARMHRMECAIKLGYEAWQRKKPTNELKEEGMVHDVEKTKTLDESSIDRTLPAPKKAKKAKECDGPSSTPFHTNRRPIFSEKKTASEPIYVPSPEESSVVKDIYLQVSVGKLECVGDPPKLSSYVASLMGGVIVHLRSEKFDLDMDFDVFIIDEFTNIEASTKTINLLALWLEHTMPSNVMDQVWFVDNLWYDFMLDLPAERAMSNYFGSIDLSAKLFTFFPIVENNHWTLVVYYNGHLRRLPGLLRGQSAILSFDSLGMTTCERYLSIVHRALTHFAKHASNDGVRVELELASSMCLASTIETPRQHNAVDCGYYVMSYIRLLIEGGIQGKRNRKWLSKQWFEHGEVEAMKEDLVKWINAWLFAVPQGWQ